MIYKHLLFYFILFLLFSCSNGNFKLDSSTEKMELLNHTLFNPFKGENLLGYIFDNSSKTLKDKAWEGQELVTSLGNMEYQYNYSDMLSVGARLPLTISVKSEYSKVTSFIMALQGVKIIELKRPIFIEGLSTNELKDKTFISSILYADKIIFKSLDRNQFNLEANYSLIFSGNVNYSKEHSGVIAAEKVFIAYKTRTPDIDSFTIPRNNLIAVYTPSNLTKYSPVDWVGTFLKDVIEKSFTELMDKSSFKIVGSRKSDARYKIVGNYQYVNDELINLTFDLLDTYRSNSILYKVTEAISLKSIEKIVKLFYIPREIQESSIDLNNSKINSKNREIIQKYYSKNDKKYLLINKLTRDDHIRLFHIFKSSLTKIDSKEIETFIKERLFLSGKQDINDVKPIYQAEVALNNNNSHKGKEILKPYLMSHQENPKANEVMGDLHTKDKLYDNAISSYEKAKKYSKSKLNKIYLHEKIGKSYEKKGLYDNAFDIYNKVIKLKENLNYFKENQPDIASTYDRLGNVLMRKSNKMFYENAKKCFTKSFDIRKNMFGKWHQATAQSYSNLGDLMQKMGQYKDSLNNFSEALIIRKKLLGQQNIDTLKSLDLYGHQLKRIGRYKDALNNYREAFQAREYLLKKKYSSFYRIPYEQMKELDIFDSSKGLLKKLKLVAKKELINLVLSYNNMGNINRVMGEHENAVNYHKMSLYLLKHLTNTKNPIVATVYNNIGITFIATGKYDEALIYLKIALDIEKQKFSDRKSIVAAILNNIGDAYHFKNQLKDALKYHDEALDIFIEIYGDKHPQTAICYYNIGIIYYELKEYKKSKVYLDKASKILSTVNSDHPYLIKLKALKI